MTELNTKNHDVIVQYSVYFSSQIFDAVRHKTRNKMQSTKCESELAVCDQVTRDGTR